MLKIILNKKLPPSSTPSLECAVAPSYNIQTPSQSAVSWALGLIQANFCAYTKTYIKNTHALKHPHLVASNTSESACSLSKLQKNNVYRHDREKWPPNTSGLQWSSFSNSSTSFFISNILERRPASQRVLQEREENNCFFIGCYPVLLLCSRLSRFFLWFATRGWKQRRKQQPSGFVVAALLCNNCVQASAVDSIFPAWRQDNEGDLSCSCFISKSFCAHLCLVWVIVHAQKCFISEHLCICGRE